MEERVLQLLTEAEGYLSGQQIGQALGVSRAAVWKAVERLRARGYVIDSVTRPIRPRPPVWRSAMRTVPSGASPAARTLSRVLVESASGSTAIRSRQG